MHRAIVALLPTRRWCDARGARDSHIRRRVGKSAHEILRTLIDREARFYPPYGPRIARVITQLNSIKPEQIDGTEAKVVKVGEREMPGQMMLLIRALPQFYFHCTTAYDILRHSGVPLGKSDFMGKPVGQ
ncbi:MAG TPA: DUF1993 family protein [Xanthobacteraceae bacterium]|nr:DUF1993 family protein [Xanthobacteraceae bacterium]